MGARPRTAPSPPRDFGLPDRYKLVRRIASGGMGSVWCARDGVLGRNVAIKLLGEQFLDDERAVRRFEREARAAAQLSGHPNVVTIYDVGETEARDRSSGRPFIVMEHLAGGSVADALRVGAVDRADAVRWITEAAAAVDHGHQQGIVHRDIKPGNLLLDRNRTLHVGDFGIARIATEDTITGSGQLFGSAAYVSPEQALGRPATAASDRYSLAVAAYELLVGERPFIAEHFAAQARQHIEAQPPRPSSRNPELPAALDAVLIRGMAKRPEDRWPTASAFAVALGEALVKPPVAVAAPTDGAATDAAATVVRPPPRARSRPQAPVPPPARPEFIPATQAGPGRRSRAFVLAALLAAVLAVGIAIAASSGSAPRHLSAAAGTHPRPHPTSTTPAHGRSATPAKPRPSSPAGTSTSTGTSTPTNSAATTGTVAASGGSPAAATSTSASPDALQAQGHQLMLSGDYPTAIAVLRRAVAASSPSSLTYAYALYDLGRSLRLSGQPQAAIPVLQQRLQIPNQTVVVRQELDLALAAAGQGRSAQVASSGSSGGGTQASGASARGQGQGGGN